LVQVFGEKLVLSKSYLERELEEHQAVAAATFATVAPSFAHLLAACTVSIKSGGKILLFGNGGSASDAQHLATELTVRFVANRRPIAAIALTTDSSALTAIGNDLGFDQLFSRQVTALGRAGDIAIGISTSGRSSNVLAGLRAAKELGILPAAFSGGDGGELVGLADPLILIPSTITARIQEMHIVVGQILCGALEIELGLV